jgi:uncharacterized protein (DUF2252 family)
MSTKVASVRDGHSRRATAAAPRTAAERTARGKAARAEVPRSSHAAWAPVARQDPVGILEAQATTRVPELVPIRYGRMLVSPFTFYRGSAAVMAADLAQTPQSGIRAQLCGDAHLANFGGFASPERELVFDINDFDETLPGPWEWDVKRLAASVEIAGRDLDFKPAARRSAVLGTVRAYREAIRSFATMRLLDVWYARLDAAGVLERVGGRLGLDARKDFSKQIAKARTKDSMRAFAKLTGVVDGKQRILADPPLIVPIEDLAPGAEGSAIEEEIKGLLSSYHASLPPDRRRLSQAFRYGHLARKVVGVGSVGTRAWIVLLLGRDDQDPLFLQLKEAEASVLEPFAGASRAKNQGQRVVEGQRLMQAASDVMLGWMRVEKGLDGRQRDFYGRQLWDWKVSADIERMRPSVATAYGQLCGWTLARAHARSGDGIAIAAYLGSGDAFDRALAEFASAYADQNERDYGALAAAVETGAIEARTDL